MLMSGQEGYLALGSFQNAYVTFVHWQDQRDLGPHGYVRLLPIIGVGQIIIPSGY